MKRSHTILTAIFIAILLIGGVGILLAQSSDRPQSGADTCDAWVFSPEPIASSRYDGYLMCPRTGELWVVNGAKKELVTEK